jgi:4-oxalocrotonate tautomerase family enzyme
MPYIEIHLTEGRTPEMKEALAKRLSAVFEEEKVCSIEAVSIVFHDVPVGDWIIGGKIAGIKKS